MKKELFLRDFLNPNSDTALLQGCFSRSTNRRINHLHRRVLTLVYDDYELIFNELLEKDESYTIHHYNIQTLCIALYIVNHSLSQTIFQRFGYMAQQFV